MLSLLLNPLSTESVKPNHLTVTEDNNEINSLLPLYAKHRETDELILKLMQSTLDELTPVNSSSLFWLI